MGFFSSPLFLGIVAVMALLYGLPVVIGAWKLSRLTFLCDPLERQPANAVPEYVHEYFTDAITALESHQFKRVGYYTIEAMQGHLEWSVLLQNSHQTRALVLTVTQSETTSSVLVILSTFFADQGLLETINQLDPGFFPSQKRLWQQFVSPVDVDELLQIHQQKLIELSKSETILRLTADQFLAQGKTHSIQRAEYLKQLGRNLLGKPPGILPIELAQDRGADC
ncbi:MAG: hypothetical protein F6K00_21395 [Leptolyngbya sp. SIOISBB]|nr:hypothetical protein [Leptolyngbya sp. SIOISBB]